MIFIAEIGINHNGDLNLAKQLIDVAVEAGADVVKFQKRNVKKVIHMEKWNEPKDTPWGTMKYINYKEKLEFGKEEYDEIDKYCREVGIHWTASPWDIDSVNFLAQYNVPFIKIASALITDMKLLSEIKKTNIPIIISTGMSTKEEIINAVNFLGDNIFGILHCNSSYPAKDEELNLATIKTLKEMFPNYKIGYSGHEINIEACLIARAFGAEIFERHITLDRDMWGSDQKASIEPYELKNLIKNLNKVPSWIGNGKITVYPSEEKIKRKLRIAT